MAIDNLSASPIHTAFYTVCTRTLKGRLPAYAAHVLRTSDAFRELPAIVFAPLRSKSLASPDFDPFVWPFSELVDELRPTMATLQKQLPVLLKGFPLCTVADRLDRCHESYIVPRSLHPTSALPVPPLSPPFYPPACLSCPVMDRCPGVPPSYIERYGESEFSPSRFGAW